MGEFGKFGLETKGLCLPRGNASWKYGVSVGQTCDVMCNRPCRGESSDYGLDFHRNQIEPYFIQSSYFQTNTKPNYFLDRTKSNHNFFL